MSYSLTFRERLAAISHSPLSPRVACARARFRKYSNCVSDELIADANFLANHGSVRDLVLVFSNQNLLETYDSNVHLRLAHRLVDIARKEVCDEYRQTIASSASGFAYIIALRKSRDKLILVAQELTDLLSFEHINGEAKKVIRSFTSDAFAVPIIGDSLDPQLSAFFEEILKDR